MKENYTITLKYTDLEGFEQVETMEFRTYQEAADRMARIARNNAELSKTNDRYVRYDSISLETTIEGE